MAIATHLFFLHRGALHVTSGQKGEEEDEGKGPHYRGKKQLRVRVCERMGSFVGIYDPYSYTARLPIEVIAARRVATTAAQPLPLRSHEWTADASPTPAKSRAETASGGR